MLYYLMKEKLRNMLLILLIIVSTISKTSTALTLSNQLNALIAIEMQVFIFWTIAGVGLWAVWLILLYVITVQKEQVIRKMSFAIRNDVTKRLTKASWQTFHKEDVGSYVSWLCNDVKLIEDSAFRSYYLILEALFTTLFSIISLWNYSPIMVILINQKPYLFNTTIRDNILMGKCISKERMDEVLEWSDLTTVICELPLGLDTPVTGNGSNLSGGQRQRVTLARAIASEHKIIILDEGTSALNKESALKIEQKLLRNPELTIIMIIHHLHKTIEKELDAIYKIPVSPAGE